MGSTGGQKLSGLQKHVLNLYRGFLRAARTKPPEGRRQVELIVSEEFRRNSKQIDRKNFVYIEYLLRRGKKQLDQIKNSDIVSLSSMKVGGAENKDT
ncbi:succinate dehydrogenase assembly factor 1, mitochondrial [Chenopodium quinoa]|uniref:Complex 1 LYR protein domain-containing protein n=1 Tax=Chenopodium quinoa TaxID=63459 RepID=A0A803M2A8_CHEQI|nr:succinate dehydrogenase assembly factor 1, mitochondrial [Chenopodium quinoa]XP_021729510.1 succinate dehydrogenase assembly factor 1, mitochondrial [Chenopodium quinoa]